MGADVEHGNGRVRDGEDGSRRPVLSRRSLCYGAGGLVLLAAVGSLKFTGTRPAVRPPGAQEDWDVIDACVHCARCVEACPHHAITLSHIEDGIVGMRTPKMSFASDWCSFCVEENGGVPLCASACPSGALDPARAQGPQGAIGKARIVEDWCLAYHETGCHTCYDNCPYGAIELDAYSRPRIVAERCNGCGACEATCVSLTNGSLSLSSGVKTRAVTVHPLSEEEE